MCRLTVIFRHAFPPNPNFNPNPNLYPNFNPNPNLYSNPNPNPKPNPNPNPNPNPSPKPYPSCVMLSCLVVLWCLVLSGISIFLFGIIFGTVAYDAIGAQVTNIGFCDKDSSKYDDWQTLTLTPPLTLTPIPTGTLTLTPVLILTLALNPPRQSDDASGRVPIYTYYYGYDATDRQL